MVLLTRMYMFVKLILHFDHEVTNQYFNNLRTIFFIAWILMKLFYL